MNAALAAVCTEYGPRLAEEALREAGAPDAWTCFVEMAQEISDRGGNGAEFLRRLSILVYSYASAVVIHKRIWDQARASGDGSASTGAAWPEIHGALSGIHLVQLSLWE